MERKVRWHEFSMFREGFLHKITHSRMENGDLGEAYPMGRSADPKSGPKMRKNQKNDENRGIVRFTILRSG